LQQGGIRLDDSDDEDYDYNYHTRAGKQTKPKGISGVAGVATKTAEN